MPSTRRSLRLLAGSVLISGMAGAVSIPWLATILFAQLHAEPAMAALVSAMSVAGVLAAIPIARRLATTNARLSTIALLAGFRLGPVLALAVWLYSDALGAMAIPLLATALLFCALCLGAMAGPHDAWLQRVVPRGVVGRFLGWRSGLSELLAGGACLAVGMALEWKGSGILGVILMIGAILGYAEIPVLLAVGDGRPRATAPGPAHPIDARYVRLGWQIARSGTAPFLATPWILPGLVAMGLSLGGATLIAAAQILSTASGMILGGRIADHGPSQGRIGTNAWIRTAALASIAVYVGTGGLNLPILAILVGIEAAAAGAWSADTSRLGMISVKDGDPVAFATIQTIIALSAGAMGLLGTLIGWLWSGPCLALLALVAAAASAALLILPLDRNMPGTAQSSS
jgi:hypothetical protein